MHMRGPSLESWTISPQTYPRFDVSIRFSGERIHSLYQILRDAQGPPNGRNQATLTVNLGRCVVGGWGKTKRESLRVGFRDLYLMSSAD